MRIHSFIRLAATLATAEASLHHNVVRSGDAKTETPDSAPKRYIVELNSLDCGERVKARVAAAHGLRIVKTFDHDLFPAISIECDGCNAESLTRVLDADETSTRPVATVYKPSTMMLRLPEEGDSFSDDAAALNYTFHGLTGVEELHQAGILGEGATVAIVDSGVDWKHPALGNGLGPGYTVVGGHDLIGDEGWPDAPAKPDDDPNDLFGHGTHVAGIIAGKSEQFVGVAPSAKILAYKVISGSGASNEEIVIEAFLKAFDSGADIITASLGEKGGFTTNAWATLASRMVDKGVLITIAGGNDGEDGAFLMSNGAAGEHVLTVAAAQTDMVPVYPFTADFSLGSSVNESELGYSPATGRAGPEFFPETIIGWPIVPLTLNTSVTDDACEPLNNSTVLPGDLTESILLVRAGGCSLWQKQNVVSSLDVPYVLFYQDDEPYPSPPANSGSLRNGVIDAAAGAAIVRTLIEGGNVTASFDQGTSRFVGMHDAGGGRPAVFTQWGPNYDMALKPDIMAPGARVLSTYLDGSYRVLSGTSMATPYVAGVAALYVGVHGGRKEHADDPEWAKRLMARIMASGRSAPWVEQFTGVTVPEFLAPPVQVGAGLLQAGKIFNATTTIGFEGRKFELNDTAHFRAEHAVDITNLGEEEVTYSFSLEGAGAFDSWTPAPDGAPPTFGTNTFKGYYDFEPFKADPEVVMPEQMTLQPGQSGTAGFKFTAPSGVNSAGIPIYGGRVLIKASNGEELGIPYYGVAADIKETIPGAWDRSASMPNMHISGIAIAAKPNFNFNLSRMAQDFPQLATLTSYGAKEIRWDIFDTDFTEEDWSYPPTVGEGHFVGSATSWSRAGQTSYFDPETDDASDVFAFPRYNVPRGVYGHYMWLGQLADGTHIRPGSYKFRLAALRPFGEPHVAEDWDVFETPEVTVLPLNGTDSSTRLKL